MMWWLENFRQVLLVLLGDRHVCLPLVIRGLSFLLLFVVFVVVVLFFVFCLFFFLSPVQYFEVDIL